MKQIKLNGKRGEGKFALVDDEDFEYLNQFNWNVNSKGYASRSFCLGKIAYNKWKYKTIIMHRLIHNTPIEKETDHKNGNKLDNRKSNLRDATTMQNQRNRKLQENNTSGYKGVIWDNKMKKWRTRLSFNKKRLHLGFFEDKTEAGLAYNQAAKQYFGEFANLNII